MRVDLTHFRGFGKYYASGTYETTLTHMFEIFDEVRDLANRQRLPGLVANHGPFITLVQVPDHPLAYPALIIPTSLVVTERSTP